MANNISKRSKENDDLSESSDYISDNDINDKNKSTDKQPKFKRKGIDWRIGKCVEHKIYYKNCYECNPGVYCTHLNKNGDYKINTKCKKCIDIFNNKNDEIPVGLVKRKSTISNNNQIKCDNIRVKCDKHNIYKHSCIKCYPTYKCYHHIKNHKKNIIISECDQCIAKFNNTIWKNEKVKPNIIEKDKIDIMPSVFRVSNRDERMKNRDKKKKEDKINNKRNKRTEDINDEKEEKNIYKRNKNKRIKRTEDIRETKCDHNEIIYKCIKCTPECMCLHGNSVFKCDECHKKNEYNRMMTILKENNFTEKKIQELLKLK